MRGLGEMTVARQCDEIAQMLQLHRSSLHIETPIERIFLSH
jgi:hypothetical protein